MPNDVRPFLARTHALLDGAWLISGQLKKAFLGSLIRLELAASKWDEYEARARELEGEAALLRKERDDLGGAHRSLAEEQARSEVLARQAAGLQERLLRAQEEFGRCTTTLGDLALERDELKLRVARLEADQRLVAEKMEPLFRYVKEAGLTP